MHTNSKPVRGDNMALFLQLQVHSHPERYATLVRGTKWPVCTLGVVIRTSDEKAGVRSTDIKAVLSIAISGTTSIKCSDAISSSSGGLMDTRSSCGRAMPHVTLVASCLLLNEHTILGFFNLNDTHPFASGNIPSY